MQGVAFDETDEHYNNVSALFSVTFDYDEDDERCLDALERVKDSLAGYDLYVSTDLGNTQEETIDHEISVIMVYVAIVIVTVLLFTSETYGEVPVLILTFVVALVRQSGHELHDGQDLVHLQLRDEHLAAGALHRLRHHLLQPLQGGAPLPAPSARRSLWR